MANLLLLTVFLSLACSQFTTMDCLHIQHVTCQPAAPISYPSTYTCPLSWSQTIPNIVNVGLALHGFKVEGSFSYLSYRATLTNTSQSGTSILISPQLSNIQLVLLQFSVIVGKQYPSRVVQIITTALTPQILSLTNRIDSIEAFTITSSAFNLTFSSQYQVQVFLHDFITTVPNNQHQQIKLYHTSITNMAVQVEVLSDQAYRNAISSLTITVLLIEKSEYLTQFYTYEHGFDAWCSNCTQNTTITSTSITPNDITASSCTIILTYLETYTLSLSTTKQVSLSTAGNFVEFTTERLYNAHYIFLCHLDCSEGQFYDTSDSVGKCSSCSVGCSRCSNSTTCAICSTNHYLEAGTCSPCTQSSSNEQCLTCSSNCLSCQSMPSNCTSCLEGSYLDSSSCLDCPVECKLCLGPTNCSVCSSSYGLLAGQCIICNNTIGYYQSAGECLPCSDSCLTCSSSASFCTSCPGGKYLDGSQCSLCSGNCINCSNSSNCLECKTGFTLNNSQCTDCSSIDNFYWYNGQCMPCSSECLRCSNSESICTQCSQGKYLSSSTCHLCPSQCTACTGPSSCSSCRDAFILENGICLTCNQSQGYFESSGQCTKCSTECLSCSSSASNCTACSQSYYEESPHNCLPCPTGCTNCSSFQNCMSCSQRYLLNGTVCVLKPCTAGVDSCIKCADSSTCQRCEQGFQVRDGFCWQPAIRVGGSDGGQEGSQTGVIIGVTIGIILVGASLSLFAYNRWCKKGPDPGLSNNNKFQMGDSIAQ